jgi:hypothetical protein
VSLNSPNPDLAQEALGLATVTFGAFLTMTEPIRHGVAELAKAKFDAWADGQVG